MNLYNEKVSKMALENIQPGDMIFAATNILNDGSVPDFPVDTQFASAGSRGVLINTGHLEDQPNKILYLVRFEDETNELGPPVACWPDEISEQPVSVREPLIKS